MSNSHASRHLLERPRRAPRRRALLSVAGFAIGAILLGLLGTGGSFALWRGGASVQAAPVTAARVAITQTGFTPLAFTYKPGALTTTAGVQITNSGDVAGNISSTVALASGSSAPLASAITVLVWEVPTLASCTSAASSATAASFKWNTIPTLTGTLAVGATQVYCLRTSIPAANLTITGSVTPTLTSVLTVGSWTAKASASATQQNQVDTTAPTAPGTPTTSGTTATSTVLSWAASTDAFGVTAYDVYRNGVAIATVSSPGYTDSALAASTTYSYTIKAKDAAGNVSAASAARSVTTTAPPAQPTSGLWYQVINTNSGKCIDADQWGTAAGTVVLQWTCGTGTANQNWQFRATSGGFYQVVPRHAQSIAWDVNIDAPNTSNGTADGTPVQLWTYGGGTNQQWQAVGLSDGTYHFVALSTGKCLALKDASKADGGTVEQRTCATTPAQAFRLVAVS